jgi:crotonobetainyl-CoA:carnitine CoA-transferase CaiB-like acyl-CoA transferase
MSQIPLATQLAGIKVLEFSHTVMGPTAGLVFAEFGADVIKSPRRRAILPAASVVLAPGFSPPSTATSAALLWI